MVLNKFFKKKDNLQVHVHDSIINAKKTELIIKIEFHHGTVMLSKWDIFLGAHLL